MALHRALARVSGAQASGRVLAAAGARALSSEAAVEVPRLGPVDAIPTGAATRMNLFTAINQGMRAAMHADDDCVRMPRPACSGATASLAA